MTISKRNVASTKSGFIKKYSIIIPAAGAGAKMRSYGVKSLLKLSPYITLVEYQIDIIKKLFKSCEIILVAGFEADRLMGNTPGIIHVENEKFEETNIMKSLGMGLRACTTENIVIVYGDLMFNEEALKVNFENESFLILDKDTMTENEIGCTIHNHYVEHMFYDLPQKWAQIAYLVGKELKLFRQMAWNKNNNNLFCFEVLNEIIDKGGKFRAIEPKGIKANDIDTTKDYQIAQDIYEHRNSV